MEMTVHLRVDADSFFREIKKMLLEEIEDARGKKAKPSNVHKGYSYKRYRDGREDPEHALQVNIAEWDPPHAYCSEVISQAGVSTMRYEAVPCEDGGIDVTYTEEFEGDSASDTVIQSLNKAVKWLPGKHRVKKLLRQIEAEILADQYSDECAAGLQ